MSVAVAESSAAHDAPTLEPSMRIVHRGSPTFAVVLFLAAAVAVVTLDAPAARARWSHRMPGELTVFFSRVEAFGHGYGITIIVCGVAAAHRLGLRVVPRLALAATVAGMTANLLKLIISRMRPAAWLERFGGVDVADQFGPWLPLGTNGNPAQSFPSSHTAAAFGLALGLGMLFPRGRLYFLGIAALVSVQRIFIGAHYPSDVFVGAGLAWLIAYVLYGPTAVARRFDCLERRTADDAIASR